MIGISRVSATGNTFLILDLSIQDNQTYWNSLSLEQKNEFIKKYCGSFVGFQTDGFVVLHKKGPQKYKWDFFNMDASTANLCGNAVRAVYAHIVAKQNEKDIILETLVGNVEISGEGSFPLATIPIQPTMTKIPYQGQELIWVQAGIPHHLVFQERNKEVGAKFRRLPEFGPQGTNVTFIENQNPFQVVTFERGVEDFTLSCGTGAVAAAFWKSKESGKDLIEVTNPGGKLTVKFLKDKTQLQGPAQVDFFMEVDGSKK